MCSALGFGKPAWCAYEYTMFFTYLSANAKTDTHTHTEIYIYIYTHTHTHMRTHIHDPKRRRKPMAVSFPSNGTPDLADYHVPGIWPRGSPKP